MKVIVEELSHLPEGLREKAQKTEDGTFLVEVEAGGPFALEDISGLKRSLREERESVSDLRSQLSKYRKIEDPQAALDALEKIKSLDGKEPSDKAKQEFERLKEQLVKQHEQEKQTTLEAMASLEKELEKTLLENAIESCCSIEGVEPEAVRYALQNRLKITKAEDGSRQIRAIGLDGQEAMDNAGKYMSAKDFVTNILKEDPKHAFMFHGTGNTGSGANGKVSGRQGGPRAFVLTEEQARDPVVYQRMREAAAKEGAQVSIMET